MGNAAGKLNGAMVCDGGGLAPTGIYAEDAQDYDVKVVQRLILGRQLAPFYTGADEPDPADPLPGAESDVCPIRTCDDGWWSYNLMVAQQAQQRSATDAGAESLDMSSAASSSAALHDAATDSLAGSHPSSPAAQRRSGSGHARKGSGFFHRLKVSGHRSPGGSSAEPPKSLSASPTVASVRHERSLSELSQQLPPVASDAATVDACRRLLRRYVECPICFLYYPQNTNYTRCCHKPICTECFVQIKRKIEEGCIAPTHCPYCVEPNLGIVYYPPGIITGAARTNYMKHRTQLSSNLSHGAPNQLPHIPVPRLLSESGRARSYTSAESREPAIVMTDDIRPARMRELTATLQAKHREQLRSAENMALVAAATRRASARQLPEPLHSIQSPQYSSLTPPPPPPLPSRRLFARSPVSASGSRQSPTPAAPEYMAYIAAMHAAGHVDLEEFLIQEAIRQSLADQEATAESGTSQSEPITETDTTPTSASPSDPSGEQHTSISPVVSMLDNLDVADRHHHEEATEAVPLVLDESELDAIANVTSRPRPALSSAATSPVLTAIAAAPSPDDLMSFAAVDPFEHDDTAASSMMTLRSPSSPSGRPRRRPPPPPPPTHPKRGADDDTQSQTPLILL